MTDGAVVVVVVVRDGKVVLHKAYGLANREKQIAMRSDTIFSLGVFD
jgi:CubicO group peptidase (beta-lactamase class C family)